MTADLIAVTGANGYIGQHVLKRLLDAKHATRAIVRSQNSADRLIALFAQHPQSSLLTTALVPNLLRDEHVYDNAFAGCTAVIHLASALPDAQVVQDAATQFLQPAIQGTLNAAKAAACEQNVRRFVLASSITASFGSIQVPNDFSVDTFGTHTYESACKEMLEPNVYGASKQLAEQAFWAYVKEQKPAYTATALLPAVCVGPPYDKEATPDTSTNRWPLWWTRAAEGFHPEVSQYTKSLEHFAVVDIGDCAQAFVNAATAAQPNEQIDGKRLYVSERSMHFYDGAQLALQHAPHALTQHWDAALRSGIEEAIAKKRPSEQEVVIAQPFLDGAQALGIAPLTPANDSVLATYQAEGARLEAERTAA